MVVELWRGKVPDETGGIGAEKVLMSPKFTRKEVEVTEPTRLVTNVTKPTITIYRPAKDKDTWAAVLICPGGGGNRGRRRNRLWGKRFAVAVRCSFLASCHPSGL